MKELSLSFLSFLLALTAASDLPQLKTCEELTQVPMCKGLYNRTSLPNPRGHQTQEEANTELVEFSPLVSSNCTQYLRHFLCSYYLPLCEVYLPPELTVPPCRELCVHVYLSCNELLVKYNMEWPQHLSCDLFPAKSSTPWCFGPDDPQILDPQDPVISSSMMVSANLSPTHTLSHSQSNTQEGSHSTQSQSPQTHSHTAHHQSQSSSSRPIGPTPPPSVPPVCTSIPEDSFCQDVGYTKTTFPNAMGQETADEVEYELNNFALLTYMQCSPNITDLLCYYYMPECRDEPPYIIQPCRELCESVKDQCSQALKKYNMELPTNINCDILPSSSSSRSCSNGDTRDNPTVRGETGGVGSGSSKKLDMLLLITLALICMICAVLY
ncbi:uncharacterized protein LOC100634725 precursor [Amphimedon queenslandica]|uniref:DCRD n=1 Tax=Amphimedon queenslandica TaxID=400682 RepID=E2IJA9_AMPQE|nr:uncharacterized protein LOC100634725 precursor [Amphimedon queenslandica]ADO16581.1 DCRD [Amphimedon queenslandica]|eukprot:NP_001266215.1 uncharacterized protein LOC100634725 precursor [Amphimedon queenslandica]